MKQTKTRKGSVKTFKIGWSYVSLIGLEEGVTEVEAKDCKEAEEKFYEGKKARTPRDKFGWSADWIEEEQ